MPGIVEKIGTYKKTAVAIITTLAAAAAALVGFWNEIKAALSAAGMG